MRVVSHPDGQHLLQRAGAWLLEHEAENNWQLGQCHAPPQWAFPTGRLFLTVEDDAGVVGVCIWLPPAPLGFTRMPVEAVPALVEHLRGLGVRPENAIGPPEAATAFADAWARAVGARATCTMEEGIYQCSRVVRPSGIPGRLRWATLEDAPLLSDWAYAFAVEGRLPEPEHESIRQGVPGRIQEGTLAVWETDRVVSMACVAGPTPNGIRVGLVYTPPEERGHGYASACTAALTQAMLDAGRRFCFLFTDLSNPTSNKIYQAIGYEPVGGARVFRFTPR